MKCLVTGATGHIGNVLVKELFHARHKVTALVLPKDNFKMIDAYCEIITGNILDREFLEKSIVGYDVVFHLAGMVEIGSGKKKRIFDVNVGGTKNVLDACIKNKIKRFVYTSSVHAIPELPKGQIIKEIREFDPKQVKGIYAKSKAMATDYVVSRLNEGTEIVIVHPSGVIGPHDYQLSNVSQIFVDFLLGRLTAYLKGSYNFVDVRDVAKGLRLAAERGRNGEMYILSGHNVTVKELLDKIADFSGRKRIRTKIAFWFILAMSYFAEFYYYLAKQKPLMTHYSIVVLNSNHEFSNQKAINELGFSTRPIDESIKDSLEFVKENFVTKKGKRFKRNRIME
ncbi:MAG: NAD-dependent epimerase/dehydratase family protein [Bacilli bacterium]|nr:NAD-dependent epimerase/dehydratase family protein [Bacilli bacterium]MBN2697041.1 NAD-dependent epimerase/dehydratase family protein [Bacilli bacterium]